MKCRQKFEFLPFVTMLLLALAVPQANAQPATQEPTTCLDASKPHSSTSDCSMQLIPLIEAKAENEFRRLAEKFKENKQMLETLQTTKRDWGAYRNSQCMLEGMAASGPQQSTGNGMNPTIKPLSPEANKAYMKCVLRTFEEMKASLSKF